MFNMFKKKLKLTNLEQTIIRKLDDVMIDGNYTINHNPLMYFDLVGIGYDINLTENIRLTSLIVNDVIMFCILTIDDSNIDLKSIHKDKRFIINIKNIIKNINHDKLVTDMVDNKWFIFHETNCDETFTSGRTTLKSNDTDNYYVYDFGSNKIEYHSERFCHAKPMTDNWRFCVKHRMVLDSKRSKKEKNKLKEEYFSNKLNSAF